MGWQLNLKLVQQQIDAARDRQREGVVSDTPGLAGIAGEKATARTKTWDRWKPHKATVFRGDEGSVEQTYPHYLHFTDDRVSNRAERRASAADTRHRRRGPRKRQQQRQFSTRNRASRLLIKPTPRLIKRRKPA